MINCIGQLTDTKRMYSVTIGETYAHVLEEYKRYINGRETV